MLSDGTVTAIATPEFGVYDALRSVGLQQCQALENAKDTVSIKLGIPDHGWAAEYDPMNKTITLDKNNKSWSAHRSILDFAHEARHAWQDIVASTSASTTFDKLKWLDTVYDEWDAYKYQADLDDKLGWGVYKTGGLHIWNQQNFFQALNLDNSWNDYYTALHRFQLNFWEYCCWWKIYNPVILRALTENLYNK
jgi:hypothetical protein